MSPAWYKSASYRSRVVREPRKVLSEFGVDVNDDVDVRVHDSTAELRYMVLPQRPAGTDDWSEEKLAGLVTRDSLIGTQRDLQK
jgi:nitrile hydratase